MEDSLYEDFTTLAALIDRLVMVQNNATTLAEAQHAAITLAEEIACEDRMEQSLTDTPAARAQSARTEERVEQIRALLNEPETSLA